MRIWKTRHFLAELLLLLPAAGGFALARQLGQNVRLGEDQGFFVFNLDVRSGILPENDAVADFHIQGMHFALFATAGANRDDFAFLLLLFSGVRNDDAALDAFFFFNALHDNFVVERGE